MVNSEQLFPKGTKELIKTLSPLHKSGNMECHIGGNISCPPLETLPNKNNPVDCLCERKPKSLISRRGG